ncbi:hypothetical protein [Inconstantimicrobium mannanitabidum]|uniref:Uncharacterized protein n=1 Tax=Inconstantimicrobium mannanitabidum TaxID=1604901 RepID=A0ACB5R7R5_9CLOT|nr:hypothetical protein [Clostridium sp. TW13]GKX65051.1 hypothetical protein rsdtw13_03090 [Clostridium sp. TW13]
MSNKEIENAIKDVEFIKNVIDSTSISLKKLSTSFIQLGMYLLVMIAIITTSNIPVIGQYSSNNEYRAYIEILGKSIYIENGTTLNIIISIFELIFFALLIFVIIKMSKIIKKNSLTGLSKQLIILWICIIIFNMICIIFFPSLMERFALSIDPQFSINSPIYSEYGIYIITIFNLFTLSIGLLMLTIFTNLRLPKLMFIVYVIACLCLMVFPLLVSYYFIFITPVTVIIIGIYLKLIDVR